MSKRLLLWRKITILSYVLLILHIAYWFFIVSPPENEITVIFSTLYLLLLFLPWKQLLNKNPRVYMWSSYLILLYFTHAVVESYANSEQRGYALVELLLTISYFVSATFCYRYSRQQRKAD